MQNFRIPDLPDTFEETICSRTNLATYTSPEWTDIQLMEDYQVTFHRVGTHILSAYPKGRISYEGTLALFDAYGRFLKASGLAPHPYVEIADYSGIVNLPSKRTRIEVADQLFNKMENDNLAGHFVYNVPKHIKWIYNIGIRLKQPDIPMQALDTYEEAIRHAVTISSGKYRSQGFFKALKKKLLSPFNPEDNYTQDLLDYIGSINWDEHGMQEDQIPETHPLKSVFNAIAILKADHDRTVFDRENIQEKYKRLFNRIADPILVFAKDTHRMLNWNKAFLDTYEYTPEELETMTPQDLHPKSELDRVRRNIDNEKGGETHRYTHITRSGKTIDVEIRTEETDYQGRPAYISNIRDISAQNHLEAELRRHRDRLESLVNQRTRDLELEMAERLQTEVKFTTLFESSSDAVLLMDSKGVLDHAPKILDCNPAALALYGCDSKEELLRLGPRGLSPKHQENGQTSDELAGEKIKEAFDTGSSHFEWIHRNLKTGRTFPADVLLNRMTLNGKDVLQAVIRDITQRKEAEEALRRSEEKYRGMIENMQDVFFRTNMDRTLTMISPSGVRLLGYDSETQVIGKDIGELFFKNSTAFGRFMTVLEKSGRVYNVELLLNTRHNETIPVLSSCNYFTDAMDTPMGIEGTITNIRKQKEAEEALRQAKLQAEEAARTKSEFLANMSHEIRTPMNAILGMGELVMETPLNDYQKNLVTTINTETASLLGIINSILDLSKVEAGRLELENASFNLRVLFEDLAASFAITAHQKELEFISFLPPDTPEALTGDPGRLRQVLVNLVGNAIKFTREGEIFIWVDLLSSEEDTVTLRFNVRDTGIGIPPEKQALIFESFAQADGSTTRKYGGTGLGTTISKQLVRMMGGHIGLDSAPGKGSTFWFTLPLKLDPVHQSNGDTDTARKVLEGKNILVVGENPKTRFVFATHLKAWGCRVQEAPSALEALALIKQDGATDLVLTDIHMADVDGFDLVKSIRNTQDISRVPVILLTSVGRIGDNQRCRNLDIQGYLLKPIKQQALKTAITAVLTASTRPIPTPVTRHSISDIRRKKIQILLAEDYPANQQVAVRHLMNQGYQVSLAKNGQQAVDLFKAKQFHLVLMDIQMPVMDGYEATRQIRAYEKRTGEAYVQANPDKSHLLQRTPIIAMTAHAIEGYREKCLAMDMDDFMTKPLKKETFIGMVRSYVDEGTDERDDTSLQPDPVNLQQNRETSSEQPEHTPGNNNDAAAAPFPEDGPINMEKALWEFDNDLAFFTDVFNEFLTTLATQFPVMEQALADRDYAVIRENAHAIKGGAANLLAKDLAKTAAALEEKSQSGNPDDLRSALDHILFEFARLKEYSREL